nr:hypothetical protein Iba_chr09eCG4290 [Ipomoea batatas]
MTEKTPVLFQEMNGADEGGGEDDGADAENLVAIPEATEHLRLVRTGRARSPPGVLASSLTNWKYMAFPLCKSGTNWLITGRNRLRKNEFLSTFSWVVGISLHSPPDVPELQ